MSARNTLKNKALRREQRDLNRRQQLRNRLLAKVKISTFKEWANELLEEELESRRSG